MTFEQLHLSQPIVSALNELNIIKPTAVQAQCIPKVLQGQDVMVQAQTGSGKTASFALPILQSLFVNHNEQTSGEFRSTKALILAPTRELAVQITDNLVAYNKHLNYRILQMIGGQRLQAQYNKLKKGVDVVVATPGRLLELLNSKHITLEQLEFLVMDEADRMLDMGFADEINAILRFVPKVRQSLLFSATYPDEVNFLANKLTKNAQFIKIEAEKSNIQHRVFRVSKAQRNDVLIHLLNKSQWPQVIVFTRTKRNADELGDELLSAGFDAQVIHSDRTQKERSTVLRAFKEKSLQILIATDVAARGLDIQQLPCVINFDFPQTVTDYIHRIGRTGRAGKAGQAISFINEALEVMIPEICETLNIDIKVKPSPISKNKQVDAKKLIKEPVKPKKKPGIKKPSKPGGRPGISFGS